MRIEKDLTDGSTFYHLHALERFPYVRVSADGGAVYLHRRERATVLIPLEFEMVRAAMLDADQQRAAHAHESGICRCVGGA